MITCLRLLRTALLGALLAVVAGLLAILVVVPRLTGAVPLTVLSGSMEPTIAAGSVITVRPVDIDTLRIGDVITFQLRSGDPTLVTHRIVGISAGGGETTFRTKGDANDAVDPDPVREVQIRGKVWYHVPLVGHLTNGLDNSQRGFGVTALAGAMFVWAAWLATGAARDRLRSRRRAVVEPAPGTPPGPEPRPARVAPVFVLRADPPGHEAPAGQDGNDALPGRQLAAVGAPAGDAE